MPFKCPSRLLRNNIFSITRRTAHVTGDFEGKTIIIGVHAGGLGDHLAYSALPRLYKMAGAKKLLISTQTNHGDSFARNPEIIELVWKLNPFVDGITDLPANTGERGWPPAAFFQAAKTAISPIDTVAKVHGFNLVESGGGRTLPPRPDLFYKPKTNKYFENKIVCDPNSTSQPFSGQVFEQFLHYVTRWHVTDFDEIVVLQSHYGGVNGTTSLPEYRRHVVPDIFEYANIIKSAKAFLVTEAGGQSLAAALRESETYVLTTARAFNERNFLWPTNTYCVTGQMTPGVEEWP